MPPHPSQPLKDIQTPTVSDALSRNARPLVLMSVFLGVATFAVLSLVAPRYAMELKLQLSALMVLASLMFASSCIVMATLFAGGPRRKRAKKSAPAKARAEPLLTEFPEEPLVSEMPDSAPRRETSVVPASLSAAEDASENSPVKGTGAPASPIHVEIETVAVRLKASRSSGGGHRTLITGEAESVVAFNEALELARTLADSGAQTILIDWSPSGDGFAQAAGLRTKAGWNDLLNRSARFDDIIERLPGTRAHVIAAGKAMPKGGANPDANLLNLVLDALDEAYDHIIVAGRHEDARALFECIEGRFDTGITVASDAEIEATRDQPGAFLGFEVADIDLLRYRRPEQAASPLAHRIARATRPREAVAQRA